MMRNALGRGERKACISCVSLAVPASDIAHAKRCRHVADLIIILAINRSELRGRYLNKSPSLYGSRNTPKFCVPQVFTTIAFILIAPDHPTGT